MATEIQTTNQFEEALSSLGNRLCLIYFRAQWHEPCKQMDSVVDVLASRFENVLIIKVCVSFSSHYYFNFFLQYLYVLSNNNKKRLKQKHTLKFLINLRLMLFQHSSSFEYFCFVFVLFCLCGNNRKQKGEKSCLNFFLLFFFVVCVFEFLNILLK